MFPYYLSFSCILISCIVKSVDGETSQCKNSFVTMKNESIFSTSQYCSKKHCIVKCCGYGKVLNKNLMCDPAKKFRMFYSRMKYSNIPVTSSLDGSNVTKSNKNLEEHFVFINNEKYYSDKTAMEIHNFYIFEDGSAQVKFNEMESLKPLSYCVDFRMNFTIVMNKNNKTEARDGKLYFVLMIIPTVEETFWDNMTAIGMLTSCFFLLLILIVYGLLPSLRNLPGLIFMAYIVSLFITYLFRAVITLTLKRLNEDKCQKLTPVLYFAVLSKFFWLNVMSYDLCFEIGKPRNRNGNRREEYMKVAKYGLYAWGVPAVLTTGASIIDNFKLISPLPQFKECFHENEVGLIYYLHIPIGIIIAVNSILFLWTAYKIWKIKLAFKNSPDSRKSQKDVNMALVHMKLGIMTGISWIIELLPDVNKNNDSIKNTWVIYVLNFYHVLIGIIIFFLYVFKQQIFIKLCKRLNIFNDYVQKMQSSHMYSLTETSKEASKSSKKGSWFRRK